MIINLGSFWSLKLLLLKCIVHFILRCFYNVQQISKWRQIVATISGKYIERFFLPVDLRSIRRLRFSLFNDSSKLAVRFFSPQLLIEVWIEFSSFQAWYWKFDKTARKNRTANFKMSSWRGNFNLQNRDGSSHEKIFFTFLQMFEFLQFSRKKGPRFLTWFLRWYKIIFGRAQASRNSQKQLPKPRPCHKSSSLLTSTLVFTSNRRVLLSAKGKSRKEVGIDTTCTLISVYKSWRNLPKWERRKRYDFSEFLIVQIPNVQGSIKWRERRIVQRIFGGRCKEKVFYLQIFQCKNVFTYYL